MSRLRVAGNVRTTMAASRVAQRLSNPMHPGAAAAVRTFATTRLAQRVSIMQHPGAAAARRTFATRLAVLRTGDALLGYGGLTIDTLFDREDPQLVLVSVEADDSPDTLFDGLSDDSLMAAADAVLEGYGADLAPTAGAARIGAAKLVPGAAARALFDSVSVGGWPDPARADASLQPSPGIKMRGQARLLATVLVVGDDGTVHVRIRGRAADNADLRGGHGTLVEEDADCYVARLPASRVETYVPFYPLNPRTPASVLCHAVALVWPEPLPLERVVVPSLATASMLPLLYDDDTVTVDGELIPLADPTYAVVPRDKRFVGPDCYAGGVSTMVLSFIASHPQMIDLPIFLVGAPLGFLFIWAGGNWTRVWRALPSEYGGPDRPPLSRLK